MSDVNLLAFGCAVSFIAVAGAYVSVRERFTLREERLRERERGAGSRNGGFRDVA